MERALELRKHGKVHVIPILLRPVDWEKAPFAHLDCLPQSKKPITLWQNEDEAFQAVARGIRESIEHLYSAALPSSEPSSSVHPADQIPHASSPSRTSHPFVSREAIYRYDAHADKVFTVSWSPDGTRIASGGLDGTIHVWQATDGQHLLTHRGHSRVFPPPVIRVLRWSPDSSRIASAGKTLGVHVWDAKSGQRTALYEAHVNLLNLIPFIERIDWSPDGRYIASKDIDENVLHIWDTSNGQHVLKMYQRPQLIKTYVSGGFWSPDGQQMAINCRKKVYIYQSLTTRRILTYEGHKNSIQMIAWSPDSKYIASASEDKTVRIWEAITGKQCFVYAGHTHTVTAISWSPDGTRIASASYDKTVHVWDVPSFP